MLGSDEAAMSKRTGGRGQKRRGVPVAEPLNKPLTIMFNEDGIALITRAAALDDDVRANWGRRMLLAAARKRIAEEEAAAESKPDQTRGK